MKKTNNTTMYNTSQAMAHEPQAPQEMPQREMASQPSPQEVIINHAINVVRRLHPTVKLNNLEEVAQIYAMRIIPIVDAYFDMSGEREAMSEIIENDPRLATLFCEIISGAPLRITLLNAEITSIEPLYGDDDYDQYQEALEDLQNRRNHAIKHKETCDINCTCSKQEMQRFIESRQMSKDQAEKFFDYLDNTFASLSNSYIDYQLLETLWRGMFFENEMEKACKDAYIKGRNDKIGLPNKNWRKS